MNSNNTTKSFTSYIKPIINGAYYDRKTMTGGFKGGMIENTSDNVVIHIDNHSMLKSGIRAIVIDRV
jgi:hypothetical protein